MKKLTCVALLLGCALSSAHAEDPKKKQPQAGGAPSPTQPVKQQARQGTGTGRPQGGGVVGQTRQLNQSKAGTPTGNQHGTGVTHESRTAGTRTGGATHESRTASTRGGRGGTQTLVGVAPEGYADGGPPPGSVKLVDFQPHNAPGDEINVQTYKGTRRGGGRIVDGKFIGRYVGDRVYLHHHWYAWSPVLSFLGVPVGYDWVAEPSGGGR